MELLRIENVTKTIRKKKLVDNISLHVDSGEIVGFVGPNGAGKTTTIKMIMGLFSITQGSISVSGFDVVKDFEKAMMNIGGIIENPDLYKGITGRQNLEYFATMHGESAMANIDQVVDLVKMKDRINDKVKTYSLGMRQRIGIAQALIHMPSLLVLDEPTNGMDPIGIKEMRELLKSLTSRSQVGVFISSHLLSEIEIMCDRIYVIDRGQLVGEKAVVHEESGQRADAGFLIATGDDEAAAAVLGGVGVHCEVTSEGVRIQADRAEVPSAVSALVGAGASIYSVTAVHKSLEDEFIEILTDSEGQLR